MKILTFAFCLFFVEICLGQFTEIKPNSQSLYPFTQTGDFYHNENGKYLQLYSFGVQTNANSLNFATNNGPASFIVSSRLSTAVNYTKLGFNAPFIKTKLYTGITASGVGSDVNSQIYHYLDASKILEVKLQVDLGPAGMVGEEYTYTSGYQTSVEIAYAYINVLNSATNSINIRNKPFTLFVTYEQ